MVGSFDRWAVIITRITVELRSYLLDPGR